MTTNTPKLIAYTGTHGTGKTTAVYTHAALLKHHHPGCEVGIVCETARQCPYPVVGRRTSRPLETSQMWIFAAQVRAELDALERYDIVVCDRTVVDCIAYTMAGGLEDLGHQMMGMARHHVHRYDRVIIRRIEPDRPAADDGFRALDEDFRRRVEERLIDCYHRLGVGLENVWQP